MHKYLRSIGFGNLSRIEDQDKIIQDVLSHYDFKKVVEDENHAMFAEISKEYGMDIGITVCGVYDEDNLFHMEYYYPYFWGTQVTSYEEISVDRHTAAESFAAACNDSRVGTTMIFYVTNAAEYIDVREKGIWKETQTSVSLSGLALNGSVLLPVSSALKAPAVDPVQAEKKNSLYEAAENGDQEAIESLTMEDIDTYNMLSRRVRHEDVYTIVDSYFMPYGMECDLYNILGDITDVNSVHNPVTGERVYCLGLNCNDIPLDVCISEKDLTGEPEAGRRFKGNIWLQGRINF